VPRRKRRLAFAGSPALAAEVLDGLLAAGFHMLRAYTQPDRPVGRGRRTQPCPVKALAIARDIEVRTPRSLAATEATDALRALDLDALVVVAYGVLLPKAILELPRHGCINVHASLLPRWRGAAPVERALMAGDTRTGVTLMQMDEGLDTGPMLKRIVYPIRPGDTGDLVRDALVGLAIPALIDCLDHLEHLTAQPQPAVGVTYAKKLRPGEARIDWRRDAAALARHVRALNSRMPAFAPLGATRIRVLDAQPIATDAPAHPGEPGEIVRVAPEGIDVACGDATRLRVTALQLPGKKPVAVRAALQGYRNLFAEGRRWEPDADVTRR